MKWICVPSFHLLSLLAAYDTESQWETTGQQQLAARIMHRAIPYILTQKEQDGGR